MKTCKLEQEELFFNGHCKDDRIAKAKNIIEGGNLIHAIISNKYDRDKKHIRRYVRAIKLSKESNLNKVKVTES